MLHGNYLVNTHNAEPTKNGHNSRKQSLKIGLKKISPKLIFLNENQSLTDSDDSCL